MVNPEPGRRSLSVCLGSVALALAAAVPFSDFSGTGNVFWFVALLLGASAAFFRAAQLFQNVAPGREVKLFWLTAIGLRLLVLPMAPGDDIYRYFWEGRIQHFGFNPYLLGPDSPALIFLRDTHWQLMNHHEFAAIYPPGAELLLKLLTAAGSSVLLFKLVCAAADIANVFLLLRLKPHARRHQDIVWYAWNPLVIYSFAGAAHFDSLMLAPLLLAVYALSQATAFPEKNTWSWAVVAALFLGLSISIKLVPLILLPVFALALRSRMIVLPLAGLVPGLASLAYGFPQNRIFDSFREFSHVARFDDFIWWISERLIWANPAQKNDHYNLLVAAAALLASLLAVKDWRRALLWVLGICLVGSTVVHPWYITWILPFAAWRKAYGWFVLSGTIFLAFLWWETTPWWTAWQPSPVLSLAISLPPLIFWVAGKWRADKLEHGQRQ